MSLLYKEEPQAVAEFFNQFGYDFTPDRFSEVYALYNPNRKVVKIYDRNFGEERVIKVRLNDESAWNEVKNLEKLLIHYGQPRLIWKVLGDYLAFDMPWLGYDMGFLGGELSEVEYGYKLPEESFFSPIPINEMEIYWSNFKLDNFNFSLKTGLIHGDLYQRGGPNNITFDLSKKKFHMIDAEALAPVSDERLQRYTQQMDLAKNWIFESLTKLVEL